MDSDGGRLWYFLKLGYIGIAYILSLLLGIADLRKVP